MEVGNTATIHLIHYDVWVLGVYRPPSYNDAENEFI